MKKIFTGKYLSLIDPYLILSFAVPFTLYMLTLAPSVTFFDSGEFLTAAYSLGSAHSPGYPLYLMFLKPFTYIPFGNIAFRINVATAFSSSLACLGVYLLTIYLLKNEEIESAGIKFSSYLAKSAGLAAAISFSVTPRLWLQSNHDKPYPLLAFVIALIFYILLKWREHYLNGSERPGYLYACTFLAGLCMGLHQTVVLLLPAWALLILLTDWRMITRIKELILATVFALLGFSIHLYLPLRATRNPLLNWGDTKTFEQFLWHFFRKGYPDEQHPRDLNLLWLQVKAFNVPNEFSWVGVILVLLAVFFLWKRQRVLIASYLGAILTFLLVIVGYFNALPDLVFLTEEFFTPLYFLTAVFVGIGLYQLIVIAFKYSSLPQHITAIFYILVGVIFLALPASLCAVNYYENDQHNNYIAFDYATNTLRSLPQNAVMFTWGDSGAFPLWYLQGVEKMREDTDIPHTPHLVFDWYLNSMPRLFKDSNLRNFDLLSTGSETSLRIAITDFIAYRPVYIDFSTRYSVTFDDYVPVQKGIVYRMRRVTEPAGLPDNSIWETYNNRGILEKISFLDLDTGKAIMIYSNSYLEAGEFLLSIGRFGEGMAMLTKAEMITPDLRGSVLQVLMRYGVQ